MPGFSAKTLSIIFKVFKEKINVASLLGDKIFSNYRVEFANLTSPSFRSVGWVFKAAVRKSNMPCRCQHCLITLRYLSYFQLLRPKVFRSHGLQAFAPLLIFHSSKLEKVHYYYCYYFIIVYIPKPVSAS